MCIVLTFFPKYNSLNTKSYALIFCGLLTGLFCECGLEMISSRVLFYLNGSTIIVSFSFCGYFFDVDYFLSNFLFPGIFFKLNIRMFHL